MRRRNRKKWKKAPIARNKAEKCATPYCRNRRAEKLTKYTSASGKVIVYTNQLKHCWKCHSRVLKQRHPVTYVLNMLRHSARKRNLPFTLTIDEFTKFCAETNYLERRGNKPDSLTVDRIDWNEGYHIWNLRVLTHAENCMQGSDNTPRDERCAKPDAKDSVEPEEAENEADSNNPF